MIAGLDLAHQLGATELKVSSDSLLVVNQIKGEFAAKDSKMASYLDITREKSKRFHKFEIQQISRSQNTQADALANLGSALSGNTFASIPIVHLSHPSIAEQSLTISNAIPTNDWTKPLLDYLINDVLPIDKLEARKIRLKASRYRVQQGVLFKLSSSGILLRCLSNHEWPEILKEFLEGECGSHIAGRSLGNKILSYCYY